MNPRRLLSARFLHPRLWIAFIAATVGICAFIHIQTWRHRAALDRWQAQALREAWTYRAAVEAALQPVQRLCPAEPAWESAYGGQWPPPPLIEQVTIEIRTLLARSRWPSRAKVEELLNAGRPFTTVPKPMSMLPPGFEGATYVIPGRQQYAVELLFTRGRYAGWQPVEPRCTFEPAAPAALSRLLAVGGILARYLSLAWLLCLPLLVFLPRYRVLVAEILMMIALTGLFMHLPFLFDMSFEDLLHRRSLPWRIVLVFASCSSLSWALFAQKNRSLVRCPVCDYNLTGNTTGICPECGALLSATTRERLALAASVPWDPRTPGGVAEFSQRCWQPDENG